MKKFCPNCGKPVKKTDNVCGNCGHKLKPKAVSSQSQTSFTPKSSQKSDSVQNTRANYVSKNKDHKKGVMWTCAGILAVVIIGGGIYAGRQYVTSKNNQATTAQSSKLKSSNKVAQSSTKKSTETRHQEHSEYSNDEWMMMGYIAYKAKDSDTTQAINDVKNYFSDGELTAHKNSSTSYTLSNEYGSVDVDVKDDEVVVSNDGTSTFSKDTLKHIYGDDIGIIKSLIRNISSSSSTHSSETDSGKWKSGIPADIVGEYTNYRNEAEQDHIARVFICDIRPTTIVTFSSGMATHYASNIRYQKLDSDTYKFNFNERIVGNIVADHSKTLPNGTPYVDSTNTLTLKKEGDIYLINGVRCYKQSSNQFHLPATPENN